jgi:hypothetical protein
MYGHLILLVLHGVVSFRRALQGEKRRKGIFGKRSGTLLIELLA